MSQDFLAHFVSFLTFAILYPHVLEVLDVLIEYDEEFPGCSKVIQLWANIHQFSEIGRPPQGVPASRCLWQDLLPESSTSSSSSSSLLHFTTMITQYDDYSHDSHNHNNNQRNVCYVYYMLALSSCHGCYITTIVVITVLINDTYVLSLFLL